MKVSEETRERIAMAFALILAAPGICGVLLFGWQVFHWLEAGSWHSVSVIDAMLHLGVASDWAESPSSWSGVWRILDWLSAAAAGVVISIAAVLIGEQIVEEGSR